MYLISYQETIKIRLHSSTLRVVLSEKLIPMGNLVVKKISKHQQLSFMKKGNLLNISYCRRPTQFCDKLETYHYAV